MNNELLDLLETENDDFQIGFNCCLNNFFLSTYLPFTQSLINQLKMNYCYADDIMLQHIEESYDALQEYLQDLIISTSNNSLGELSEASAKMNFSEINVDNFFERLTKLQSDLLKISHKQLFENRVNSVIIKNMQKDIDITDKNTSFPVSMNLSRSLNNKNFIIPDELKSTTRHKLRQLNSVLINQNNDFDVNKENNDTQKSLENLIEESFGNI
ncbi:hypothetical protein ACO0R3_002684 [Hanseniaspora guilliermondii]